MLLNPFCPFSATKVLALKAKVGITAFSALGFALLILQTLVFVAAGGALTLVAGAGGFYVMQQRKSAAA